MLTLVNDPDEPTTWNRVWIQGMRLGLAQAGYAFRECTRETFDPAMAQDGPILLSRFTLFDLLDSLPERSAILFEHCIGMPYTFPIGDQAALWRHPAVRATFVTTETVADYAIRRNDPPIPVVAFGFPYENPVLDRVARDAPPWGTRPKLAVFAQRVAEDNQPLLAVRIALRLINDHGWRVIFCGPKDKEQHYYAFDEWRKDGIEVLQLDQAGFFAVCRMARVALSTTIAGTLITSLYEARVLGCNVIAPKASRPEEPPFTDPFTCRYNVDEPMSAVEAVVKGGGGVRAEWYSPLQCALRLGRFLREGR